MKTWMIFSSFRIIKCSHIHFSACFSKPKTKPVLWETQVVVFIILFITSKIRWHTSVIPHLRYRKHPYQWTLRLFQFPEWKVGIRRKGVKMHPKEKGGIVPIIKRVRKILPAIIRIKSSPPFASLWRTCNCQSSHAPSGLSSFLFPQGASRFILPDTKCLGDCSP